MGAALDQVLAGDGLQEGDQGVPHLLLGLGGRESGARDRVVQYFWSVAVMCL